VPAQAGCCPSLGWYEPKVGDLILFRHTGCLKGIVYALAGSPGATHSAVVVARPDGSLALLEAPGTDYPVMLSDIPTRLNAYKGRIWVRRLRCPLTCEQSRCLTEFACKQEGKPFDTFGFALPPFGFPTRKIIHRCLTDENLDPPRWFCSSLCVAAFVSAGLLDPCKVRPRFTDPQDLKVDRCLDLSKCWEEPVPWHRCGPRRECWWSKTCCGKVECWRE
jgi:hypothetical protein